MGILPHPKGHTMESSMTVEEAFKAVAKKGSTPRDLAEDHQKNEIGVLTAVKQNVHVLKNARKKLRGNREFMLQAVRENGLALQYASQDLRGDYEIVLCALEKDGNALEYAANALRMNAVIIAAACAQNPDAKTWAAESHEVWSDSDWRTEQGSSEGSGEDSDEARSPTRQKHT